MAYLTDCPSAFKHPVRPDADKGVQDRAREIRSLQEEVPRLKTQLVETKGIFKGRERKELEAKIRRTEEKSPPCWKHCPKS